MDSGRRVSCWRRTCRLWAVERMQASEPDRRQRYMDCPGTAVRPVPPGGYEHGIRRCIAADRDPVGGAVAGAIRSAGCAARKSTCRTGEGSLALSATPTWSGEVACGGLFFGDDADELLEGTGEFAITQDQRNTARGQVRAQVHRCLWIAAAAQYGSGLPVELDEGVSLGPLNEQYGPRVLERINFERGRIRPLFSADFSAGADLWTRDGAVVQLQGSVMNVTDRLNVINFSGLSSGTAPAPGRWASLRLSFEF